MIKSNGLDACMVITFSTSIADPADYNGPFNSILDFNQFITRDCAFLQIEFDLIMEGEETILLSLGFLSEHNNVVLVPDRATVLIKDSKWFINSTVRNS